MTENFFDINIPLEKQALYNLGYNLVYKSEDRLVGKRYYNKTEKKFDWFLYSKHKQPFIENIIEHHICGARSSYGNCYGVSLMRYSDIIVVDYDQDHHNIHDKNISKKVFQQLESILGKSYYSEFKESGNFHAWFKYNKYTDPQNKKDIEKYLQNKISPYIEIHNKKKNVFRLPNSHDYTPMSETWQNDIQDYIDNENYNNICDLLNEIKYINYEESVEKKSLFTSSKKSKNNFIKDFQFEEGKRVDTFFNKGLGFILYKAHNENKELLKDYILSHSGTSKDLNNDTANTTAQYMVDWVSNNYIANYNSNYSYAVNSNNDELFKQHLKYADKDIKKITELIIPFILKPNTRKATYDKSVLAIECIYKHLSSMLYYQINEVLPYKGIEPNIHLKKEKRELLVNSIAIYDEQIVQLVNEELNLNSQVNIRDLLRKIVSLLLNSNILEKTMNPSYIGIYNWKTQYKINKSLYNFKKIVSCIYKFLNSNIISMYKNILYNRYNNSFIKEYYKKIYDIYIKVYRKEIEEDDWNCGFT